jgi:hypothetical protein
MHAPSHRHVHAKRKARRDSMQGFALGLERACQPRGVQTEFAYQRSNETNQTTELNETEMPTLWRERLNKAEQEPMRKLYDKPTRYLYRNQLYRAGRNEAPTHHPIWDMHNNGTVEVLMQRCWKLGRHILSGPLLAGSSI